MKNYTITNPEVEPDRIYPVRADGFYSRTCEYTINGLLKSAVVMIQSKLCLYSNLYKYFRRVCFFLNLHQHLIYSLDLKIVNKVIYRKENTSVQAKVDHGKLAKILSRPVSALNHPVSLKKQTYCLSR